MIKINNEICCHCSYCLLTCPSKAIESNAVLKITQECVECLVCIDNCPTEAQLSLYNVFGGFYGQFLDEYNPPK